MKILLAMALVLPLLILGGCGGTAEVPALTQPGVDPAPEQQKNWMEESGKRGSVPKNLTKPKAEKTPTPKQ